jgi:hypothetical protein
MLFELVSSRNLAELERRKQARFRLMGKSTGDLLDILRYLSYCLVDTLCFSLPGLC